MEETICILCPTSCRLRIRERKGRLEVRGAACERGTIYAESELVEPTRVFTGTVRVTGGRRPVVPVKSDRPVPRESLMDAARATGGVKIGAPVVPGQVVAKELPGGARLIATSAVEPGGPPTQP